MALSLRGLGFWQISGIQFGSKSKRLGLDYLDIFYHPRPDPETPMEETMTALDFIVRSGRALYVVISNYSAAQTREATTILKSLGTPCLILHPIYNMFSRWIEKDLLNVLEEGGQLYRFFTLVAGFAY